MLQRVVDACAPLPLSLFVTATDDVQAGLKPVGNTFISGYVRHRAVLPNVDLFICHAGLSSIAAALTCGVPMICIPQFHEQPDNAAHVAALGVGVALPTDASVDDIRDAVEAALANTELRKAAERVVRDLHADGVHPAVEQLEAMLASGR